MRGSTSVIGLISARLTLNMIHWGPVGQEVSALERHNILGDGRGTYVLMGETPEATPYDTWGTGVQFSCHKDEQMIITMATYIDSCQLLPDL